MRKTGQRSFAALIFFLVAAGELLHLSVSALAIDPPIYANDFATTPGAEWSTTTTDVTPTGGDRFLGQFTNASVSLTLSDLPTHSLATVSFDLLVLKSWDGNSPTQGPDRWSVTVDGISQPLLDTTFSNCEPIPQSYPGSYPSGSHPPTTGHTEVNSLGYTQVCVPYAASDAVYRMEFSFAHTGDQLSVTFAGAGLSSVADESWGLDNVEVVLDPTSCIPPPSGLVSWWPGEGSADDIVGANDGALTAGVGFTTGRVGQAFSFTSISFGGTGVVTIPHSASIDFAATDSFTVEAWLNETVNGGHILGKRPGGVCTGEDGFYQMAVGTNSFPNVLIGTNVWHHIATTWDGSTLRQYIDGVATTNGTYTPGSNTAPLTFGTSGACNGFAGALDEVSIYDRVLSITEIQSIYSAGSFGKCAPTTPTHTPTGTQTGSPTATPTSTPTDSPGSGPTSTPTRTPTATPTSTPTSTPTFAYAALGDSISSGEGARPYDPTTDVKDGNRCHRSMDAYPPLLAERTEGISPPIFVACSGAKTENIQSATDDPPGVPQTSFPPDHEPQLDQLDHDQWDLLTITVGANDLKFSELAYACANLLNVLCHLDRPFLPFDSSTREEALEEMINGLGPSNLPAKLERTYSALREYAPANGAVVVLGYPKLLPEILLPALPTTARCLPVELAFDLFERQFFARATESLDRRLAMAASQAGVHYISVLEEFSGHEVCAPFGQEWINYVTTDFQEILHPNRRGHEEYAKLLENFISMYQLGPGLSNPPPSVATLSGQSPPDSISPSWSDLRVRLITPGCRPAETREVVPGELVTLSGDGFGPGNKVLLRVALGRSRMELGTVIANDAGSIDTQIQIPNNLSIPSGVVLEALGLRSDGGAHLLMKAMNISASTAAADSDGDGVPDLCDNCISSPNLDQADSDGDGRGDACDTCPQDPNNDLDGDGLCEDQDLCPADAANDIDGDGLCASEDNCQLDFNPDQADSDEDGRGDACAHKACYSIDIAVSPPNGGGLSVSAPNCRSLQYEEGSVVEVNAGGFNGHTFVGWSGDVSGTSTPLRLTINDDLQVAANFAPAQFPSPAPLLSTGALLGLILLLSSVAFLAIRRRRNLTKSRPSVR